jgi:hypothetical protein
MRKIFGPAIREEETGENYNVKSFVICIPHPVFYDGSYQRESDGPKRWHIREIKNATEILCDKT